MNASQEFETDGMRVRVVLDTRTQPPRLILTPLNCNLEGIGPGVYLLVVADRGENAS